MNTQTTKIAITFPKVLMSRLRDRAEAEYGFSVPEIVRKLAADYIDNPQDEAWTITPEQEAVYIKDIAETEKLLAEGKVVAASSGEELRKQIEEENAE